MPSQRLRIARYLNASCWMCQAKSGWPKWQKYHALRGDTALEPKFYVKKRLALPRAASDFSPPEGAEGETHAWPRSRLITGFRGGEAKDPLAGERWSVTRSPGHHHLQIGGPTEHTTGGGLAFAACAHLPRSTRQLCQRPIIEPLMSTVNCVRGVFEISACA